MTPPLTLNSLRIKNPVYSETFADPFVILHKGTYYAIGTGPVIGGNSGAVFPMLRSDDFVNWHPVGGGLIPPKGLEHGDFWAPEIAYSDGTFFMYYSVGMGHVGHQLRVATSANPTGPYRDQGTILDPSTCDFAIDANPFQDLDGSWYLYYSRDFLDGDRAGTALVVAPLQDMMRIPSDYVTVARATQDWQRYMANRPMYDGVYDWHTLEGACALHHDGKIVVLYSGGNFQNESYGLDYVTADHVMGPYTDSSVDHPRVLRTAPGRVLGPGHNSVVKGPDGNPYIAYHAWDPAMTARRLCIDQLLWTPDGPRCNGPS